MIMLKRKVWIVLSLVMTIMFFGIMNLQLAAYEAQDLERLLTTNRCPGGDLRNTDLSGHDLEKANLVKADLSGANLSNVNLKDANLNGAILERVNLTGAVLQDAKLSHTILKGANFKGADLRGADLKFADLDRASFRNADLRKADLSFANLVYTDFTGANLEGIIVKHTYVPTATPTPTPTRRPTPTSRRGRGTSRPTATIIPTPSPTPRPTPTMGPEQGMISGRVISYPNAPNGLSGALIEVYNGVDFSNLVTSTTGDFYGYYAFSLAPGEYKLMVQLGGYLPLNAYTKVTQGVITYDPLLTPLASTGQGIGSVTGFISNSINGQPVNGLTISFREGVNARVGPVVATATTDPEGRYSLSLPAGNYTGEVTGADYYTEYLNVTVDEGWFSPADASVTRVIPEDQIRITLNGNREFTVYIAGYDNDNNSFRYRLNHKGSNQDSSNSSSNIIRLDYASPTGYGPVTMTILNKWRLKNAVYAVYDGSNFWPVNSGVLPTSQAVVRVYQGNNVTATFHVPASQTGNLWAVFSIDQTGIHPINQMVINPDLINIFAHDFNGDGLLDLIGMGTNQLTVFRTDGSKQEYVINEPYWGIAACQDTDGTAGDEIIVQTFKRQGYIDHYLIIHDRTQSVKAIADFGETVGYFLTAVQDLDGAPGSELVLEKYPENQHLIRIISDRDNIYRDFSFPNLDAGFYLYPDNIAEVNGTPGKELILYQSNNYGPSQLATINFRDNRVNYYPFDEPFGFTFADTDGAPGQEIIVQGSDTVAIIHDGTQSVSEFSGLGGVTTSYLLRVGDLDGEPGNELIVDNLQESPYHHTVRIIADRANLYQDYDFSNFSSGFHIISYDRDLNGRPGNELVLAEDYYPVDNRIAVLSFLDNQINTYAVENTSGWYILGYENTDGDPGLEIICEAYNPSGDTEYQIVIIKDQTQTVSQIPCFTNNDLHYLRAAADLDGAPGRELVFEKSSFEPYEYFICIISDQMNTYREINISNFSPGYRLDPSIMTDLNGQPGEEVVLKRYWPDNRVEYAILDFRTGRITYYSVEPDWYFIGVYDYDGQPGKEIVFSHDSSYQAICDALGIVIQ